MTSKQTLATIGIAIALFYTGAAKAGTYGPPEPKPFTYPDRFTVHEDETLEQAQAKVEAKRRCARTWALAGIAAGTALDIVTTQSNQRAGYRELNPLYGKRASIGEQLIGHAISGGFAYWRIDRQARHNPASACKTARIVAGAQLLPGIFNIAVRIRM